MKHCIAGVTSLHQLLLPLLLWVFMLLASSFGSVNSICTRPPIIFSFGDSNSDTGGLAAGLGYPINSPNGRSFFDRPNGRLSDGRLIIDFFCQNLNTSFLSPYLESLGSNFSNGANFAVVGSSALPKYVPFALNVQVMQFLHFKARSIKLAAAGSDGFIDNQGFSSALYLIDIGQNDLADSFSRNLSYAKVVKRIPLVIAEIKNAVKALYAEGGRKFWIHNTGPLGCLPQKLWSIKHKDRDTDILGCISSYNDAAKVFNAALLRLCQELKSEFSGASLVYVDVYSIKYDILANASKYGFSHPLMACCGFGGPPYNYNSKVTCGNPSSEVCSVGSQYVNWDGIHYSEAANAIVSSKILSTEYSTPRATLDFFCP